MKRVFSFLMGAALLLGACQSQRPVEDKTAAQPAPPLPTFAPASSIARIGFDSGKYPDLFAPETCAIWVAEAVTEMRRDAAVQAGETVAPEEGADAAKIAGAYVIIECHLESAFADSSIAYDAVGLRGLNVYLSTPDGRKIPPIQTLIGTPLKQEPRGALKVFGRTNLIAFPKRDLWIGAPLLASDVSAVRLVIEGHDSVSYFEWASGVPGAEDGVVKKEEASEVLKTRFRDFFERVRALAHITS